MKSPTVADVAKQAGVSYATADRVLNNRGNVAQKSVQKVQTAVQKLGYVRNIAAANLSRQRTFRLAFVLPHRTNPFFRRMHENLDEVASQLKSAQISIEVIAFEAFDHDGLNRALGKLSNAMGDFVFDGVAIVGLGRGAGYPALEKIRQLGKPVVSLVSDLPNGSRDHYIGIDNIKAGRTAARLLGMSHGGQAGRIVLTVGSMEAHDHAARAQGFREVLGQDFPHIEIVQILETLDQTRLMRSQLTKALVNGDVTGLYNTGAGNDGLIDALRSSGSASDVFCVLHELTEDTRAALDIGIVDVVIDQRPEVELNRSLALMRAVMDGLAAPTSPELIPAIYLRDNLPAEPQPKVPVR